MERGFKTWCENVSLQMRRELGVTPTAPLGHQMLADYLDVNLWTPPEIARLSTDAIRILLGAERNNWSAVTVSQNNTDAVIYNPTHSEGRRSSDVMHELSHLLIGHRPSTLILSPDGNLALRSYDRAQEEEAGWLSGALLLPRPVLLCIAQSQIDFDGVCSEYVVSDALLTFRMDATGVTAQMRRLRTS